jgi:hypothetical protein
MKTIKLPIYGIVVTLNHDEDENDDNCGMSGVITDELHVEGDDIWGEEDEKYNCAIDGITSMILAHACAGIDIESPAYLDGIESAVNACAQQFE